MFVSRTFERQFRDLEPTQKDRIKNALRALGEDPYTPRAGFDIKSLSATHPKKYRLRIGDYRIIYTIDKALIKVIEVFRRGRGYRI